MINISDDINRRFVKTNTDVVDIIEIQSRIFAANRILTESLTLNDELSFAEHHLLVDMLTIQELIAHSCEMSTTDTLVIVGEVSKKNNAKSISDEFTTTDDLTKSIALYIINTKELADVFSKTSNFDLSTDSILSIEDHFKADRYERMRRDKTILPSSTHKTVVATTRNKVYLFHQMRK